MITETKDRIRIQDLTLFEPRSDTVPFNPSEFINSKDLNLLENMMIRTDAENQIPVWFMQFNLLNILSPERATIRKIPEDKILSMRNRIWKAKEENNFTELSEFTAAAILAVPDRREEFAVSDITWRRLGRHLDDNAGRNNWLSFLNQYMNMHVIRPDHDLPYQNDDTVIDGMKSILAFVTLNPPINIASDIKILFPERSDLYKPDHAQWRKINKCLRNRKMFKLDDNDIDSKLPQIYFSNLTGAMILAADTARITKEKGLEIINNPKKLNVGQSNKPIPERRMF